MIVGQFVTQPGAELTFSADFSGDLSAGESIVSASATSRNYADQTDTTAAFLAAGPPAQIDAVTQSVTTKKRLGGGAHGQTHIVTLTATTNLGNTFPHEIEVIVIES